MKNKILFFFIFLSSFGLNLSTSANNIIYIDMERILKESKPGAVIINELKKMDKDNLSKFSKIQKNLKDEELKLIKQKNILSKEDFNNKIKVLKNKISIYNQDRKKAINDLNVIKNQNTDNFLELINPILTNYLKENSISIALHKKHLIIGESDLDKTNDIIKLINEKIN